VTETSPTLPKLSNYKKIPPGPRSRFVKRRFTDLRSREGKELAAIIGELEQDLGPPNPGQRVLLETLRAQLAVARAVASWAEQQPAIVQQDGRLLPALGENFLAYTNSIRLGIVALYDLSAKKKVRGPDLDAYLRSKTVDVP